MPTKKTRRNWRNKAFTWLCRLAVEENSQQIIIFFTVNRPNPAMLHTITGTIYQNLFAIKA